ncbi:MAG: exosortase/archaeosortase family protein [Proteobacteria bacterium]|nr:exosortase/archaeosortase family protein [Pseudomonadota bacterium]
MKSVLTSTSGVIPRNIYFLFFNIAVFTLCYTPIRDLLSLSLKSDLYSHVPLIPLISIYLIYSKRSTIFQDVSYSMAGGLTGIVAGILLYLIGLSQSGIFSPNDYLSLTILSALILWLGGFLLFYGDKAFKEAIFPLLFLLSSVPMPDALRENLIYVLQINSADVSHWLFKMSGVPVYREGNIFMLPAGVNVEVAKQCSGIRSSIVLILTGILLSHFYLKSNWRRLILILSIFPIAVFKNGVRILTLSLLSVYVDKRFITDSLLHKKGGIIFFLLGVILLLIIMKLLKRNDKGRESLNH